MWQEYFGQLLNRDVQMDNLRGLLGIRRMDRGPNSWIRCVE